MPLCYAFVPDLTANNKTPVVTITSPLSALRNNAVISQQDATDGVDSIIAFVEAAADKAVPWSEPIDLPLEALEVPEKVLQVRNDAIHVGLLDGSALDLPADMPRDQSRAAVDANDKRRSEIITQLHAPNSKDEANPASPFDAK